ncbi:chemotaxis protein CheW [Sorangium cellulosum]|uniref:Chemotaxis protein CheW n=1 Tax=Sorangium cellulosum TaxID=56 RepID=A0A150QKQ0_SORCE|nr:chemotaxis protein CheW [Sorangium cellulosum]KYF68561.1 chemotaxis protein CheW [Sorangium cellulosum]
MSGLHVVLKVADTEYAISAADVLHMESFTGATRVPGTRPYVGGLIQIRGRVVPVVDLRARFGLPTIEPTLDSRVIVVQSGGRTVGLLVDSAREVVNIAADELRPPPEVMTEESSGFVRAVAKLGKRLVMLVDVGKVIGEEQDHGR